MRIFPLTVFRDKLFVQVLWRSRFYVFNRDFLRKILSRPPSMLRPHEVANIRLLERI